MELHLLSGQTTLAWAWPASAKGCGVVKKRMLKIGKAGFCQPRCKTHFFTDVPDPGEPTAMIHRAIGRVGAKRRALDKGKEWR